MGKDIKKIVNPDGSVTLNISERGGRVGSHLFMPTFFVFLLLPVSCTVSSPLAFMSFDKVASRNEFQSGTAILWVLLTLFIWGGIVYAYNHRRSKIKNTLHIIPANLEEQEYGVTHFAKGVLNVHPFQSFEARVDGKSDYGTFNMVVVGKKNQLEQTISRGLSETTAKIVVDELNNALKKVV